MHECPEDLPLKLDTLKCTSCAEKYKGSKPFWSSEENRCVDACPETNLNGKCVRCEVANILTPYWNSDDHECQSCATAFPKGNHVWD